MKKLIFTESQKQILSDYSDNEMPNESCAILFGEENKSQCSIKDIFLTENVEKSPVNFTISAEQILQAYRREQEQKLKIVGIFHSHPNSEAYPSSTDKKFMELNPVIWVIFSGITRNFKAYALNKVIEEISIETG